MDFLTQREVNAFKQDAKTGEVKQDADKTIFEKKLLEGLGSEIDDALEHPEKMVRNVKVAKKLLKKKRKLTWKENLKRILGIKKGDL